MKKLILLMMLIGIGFSNVFGQEKEISGQDFYKEYRNAYKKLFDCESRRQISKDEHFENGVIERTVETITENLSPKKFRFVVIETSEKRKDKSELIKIGDSYYCKKNDGIWTNSQIGCNVGGGKGLSNVVSSKYFVEQKRNSEKSDKIYREYTIFKHKDNENKEVLFYYESKSTISADGLFVLQENSDGPIEPKQIRNREVIK